jgi:hypothetical protein
MDVHVLMYVRASEAVDYHTRPAQSSQRGIVKVVPRAAVQRPFRR